MDVCYKAKNYTYTHVVNAVNDLYLPTPTHPPCSHFATSFKVAMYIVRDVVWLSTSRSVLGERHTYVSNYFPVLHLK